MIDIRLIREERELVKENIKKKFQDNKLPLVDEVYELDIEFRNLKTKADENRKNRNEISANIGTLMREGKKEEALSMKEKVVEINKELESMEVKEKELEAKIRDNYIFMAVMTDDYGIPEEFILD